ncbi:MAG TPA: hypothetical protein VF721_04165, partial [Pyrinomonadaceae bacterium]
IAFFYLSALFGICYLILQQIKASAPKSAAPVSNYHQNFQPDQINPANTAQLESPREPAVSTTENTTKTLDEVLLKRN